MNRHFLDQSKSNSAGVHEHRSNQQRRRSGRGRRIAVLVLIASLTAPGWVATAAADHRDDAPDQDEPGAPTEPVPAPEDPDPGGDGTEPAPPPEDLDDGRDPAAEPGDPTEAEPAPPPEDLDDGRDPAAEPGDPTEAEPAPPPGDLDDGRDQVDPVVFDLVLPPPSPGDTIDPTFEDQDPCVIGADGCSPPCFHCPGPDGTDEPSGDQDGEDGRERIGHAPIGSRVRTDTRRPAPAFGLADPTLPWWVTLEVDVRSWIAW